MGLTLINQQFIIERAKKKKDGCYEIRGVVYRVRDGKATHFASGGEILEFCYGFNCVVGKYKIGDNVKKILLKIKE
ncbi:unnamed protein product [marine sediment metagenome]|uniref:Uncharacterized protein n=1 Tax=marine sediment metagenome TaxID=412755 RepID=X1DEQ4_9ZZZZ